MMRKLISAVICALLLISAVTMCTYAEGETETTPFDLDCKSAVLMDWSTGKILYSKNPDEALPPASVTKVMSLLLVMEAIDSGNMSLGDMITVSDYAASMGGSQVYLKAGEQMSVEELLKSTVIASANDAIVALGETVAGSEEAFVTRMNERAAELGLSHSIFENATGLDDDTTSHAMSAHDVAVISRELISHPTVLQYSSIWMDTIRDGAFGLTNTNRLIRFYSGATGLKTGSTNKAKFCISATAQRDGMHLIAVIMGSPTRDIRNEAAKTLLDWGFANYCVYQNDGGTAGDIRVIGGIEDTCPLVYGPFTALLTKGANKNVTVEMLLEESAAAPIKAGDKIGSVVYKNGDEVIGEGDITAAADVEKISYWGLFKRMLETFLL